MKKLDFSTVQAISWYDQDSLESVDLDCILYILSSWISVADLSLSLFQVSTLKLIC